MDFHIVRVDTEEEMLLASFESEHDRDICLDTMREEFPDCELDGQDNC